LIYCGRLETFERKGSCWRAENGHKAKGKNKEHHSRLAKVAFWRNHKDADNAKQAPATQAPSKQAQAKTTPGKKDQKQEQASNVSKPSTKKAPAANKTKPPQTQDPKTTSLKQ